MDTQSDFEREITGRIEKVESALLALSEKVDGLTSAPAPGASTRPEAAPFSPEPRFPLPKPDPGRHKPALAPSEERGADWWLARAGAGLTLVAVILLYQYAVGHGWITPWVRVLTGATIGAALMYWGRKMAPSKPEDASPVALRELMMGAALAAWYITAFVVSSRYYLIPLSASRYLFLGLSIAGGALSLKERRSGLALIAVTAGFLGPMILTDAVPSVPGYAFYIAVLGALSIVLYLMRGWQSVLWISFAAVSLSLSLPAFYSEPILLTLMGLALGVAYTRAPTLRRSLVATGSDRYPEPVRSQFATHWLGETGGLFRLLSPAAGSLDSLSIWIITLVAPLAGLSVLSRAWPGVNDAIWGVIAIVLATVAYRMCTSASDRNNEITHLGGVASLAWGTIGMIAVARGLIDAHVIDHGTITLAIVSIAAIAALTLLDQPGFVAAVAVGRLMAGAALLGALFSEAGLMSAPVIPHRDRMQIALSIAELIAIGAGVTAWRDLRRRGIAGDAANILVLMSYAALLLLDARVLGQIWRPLVTASFAIAGTTMLLMSRKEDNKMLRSVGGATLALVMFRLFFVDMAGVDTIWRVLLFLGVGALFLFTSRQLQLAKRAPSEST